MAPNKRRVGADSKQPAAPKKLKAAKTSDKDERPTALPLWKSLTKSRDGQSLTIDGPNKDVMEALRKIGHDEPAVMLDWDIAALNNAVAHVNTMAAVGVQPAVPAWITGGVYPMTAEGLQRDIAMYIAQPGGGLQGNALVAPNTLSQYANVHMKIAALMLYPFMVALCAPANCRPLARIFDIADHQNKTTGQANPPPPLGYGVRCFE
jgi:hypothetical protein